MIPEIETLERELARTGRSKRWLAMRMDIRYSTLLCWFLGRRPPNAGRRVELAEMAARLGKLPDKPVRDPVRAIRGRPRVFCSACGDRMADWRSGRPSDRLCEACLGEGRGIENSRMDPAMGDCGRLGTREDMPIRPDGRGASDA